MAHIIKKIKDVNLTHSSSHSCIGTGSGLCKLSRVLNNKTVVVLKDKILLASSKKEAAILEKIMCLS